VHSQGIVVFHECAGASSSARRRAAFSLIRAALSAPLAFLHNLFTAISHQFRIHEVQHSHLLKPRIDFLNRKFPIRQSYSYLFAFVIYPHCATTSKPKASQLQ
jgi:hypothetical protein